MVMHTLRGLYPYSMFWPDQVLLFFVVEAVAKSGNPDGRQLCGPLVFVRVISIVFLSSGRLGNCFVGGKAYIT